MTLFHQLAVIFSQESENLVPTCICISWDYVSCPCYYETGGRHTPDNTTLVAFCMVRSCNWPERRLYPTTWDRHSIGTSLCPEHFDQLPRLSRHFQWLAIPCKITREEIQGQQRSIIVTQCLRGHSKTTWTKFWTF